MLAGQLGAASSGHVNRPLQSAEEANTAAAITSKTNLLSPEAAESKPAANKNKQYASCKRQHRRHSLGDR
jgi:hypothetical protein